MKYLLAVHTLWWREIIRFYRQPSRVVGAIGSPLVFWLLIGSGIGSSFRSEAQGMINDYAVYFFPGTLLLILLFTAIFSTISLIEDRREGFLQGVLVSPASKSAIVMGKILGGVTLAVLQSLIFLLLAPIAGITFDVQGFLLILGALALNAFVLTSLGFFIAWQFESIQGFHAVMNLLLFPLWILSGALFPPEGSAQWIQILMQLNPLTYGMNVLHASFFVSDPAASLNVSVCITSLFGVFLFVASVKTASRRNSKNVV